MNGANGTVAAVTPSGRAGLWRVSTLRQVVHDMLGEARQPEQDHRSHLRASVEWLVQAQDVARAGGVSPGWTFGSGWADGDPATGGRLIETLAPAALYLGWLHLPARIGALRDSLLVARDAATPDRVLGLLAAHVQLNCQDSLDQALADAWRLAETRCESAGHAALAGRALAVAGRFAGEPVLLAAARRQLAVVRARQTSCGWFADQAQPASTLALAATLHDLLEASVWLDDAESRAQVARATLALARQLTGEGRLDGAYDDGWVPAARHVCLAGLARLTCVWIRLAQIEGEVPWRDAAWRGLAWIKRNQRMLDNDPVLRNGLPSTVPSWAGPRAFRLETLTMKYFADALMMDMAGIAIPPPEQTRPTR